MHKCTECGIIGYFSCLYTKNNKLLGRKVCGDCFIKLANKTQIKKEAYRLRIAIYFHKQLYYEHDQPIMEDWAFDQMEKFCWKLEDLNPFDMRVSTREQVGDALPSCYYIKVKNLIKEHFRQVEEYNRLQRFING